MIAFSFQVIFSLNLRNLILTGESDKYKLLASGANKTFFQLYNIKLDFQGKNIITYNDEKKYYRVVINEYDVPSENENTNNIFFEINKNELNFPYIPPIIKNLTFDIFGRTYKLHDEYKAILNILSGIFAEWDAWIINIHKPNIKKIESQIFYTIYYNADNKNKNGSFTVTIEDKEERQDIIQSLSSFWEKYKDDIPVESQSEVIIISEFVINNLALSHNSVDRNEILTNSAKYFFKQLYNLTIDFDGKNIVQHNDDISYYRVIIEEFPKPHEGIYFTIVLIEDGRFYIPDGFPSDLTFSIFGRSYNLKQEYQSILYLFSAPINNGEIQIYKNDINKFEPEVKYKYYVHRKNDENYGLFHVIFEDKDDKLIIEETLETFWNNNKDKIPQDLSVDVKIAAEFVVTTFGIWHNIANRYDKIVKAANNTLYQVFNITLNFQGRYIVNENNDRYLIRVTIDEFPEIPKDVETYFNITSGRVSMPKIEFVPDVKFELFEQSLDLEKEYKSIANMFAAGIRNGKVYLYKKDIDKKVTEIRFKCFVCSESGDTYGAFEISLEDKNDRKTIEEALEDYWKKLTNIAESVLKKIKYISDFVGRVIGVKDDFMKIINPPSSSSDTSSSFNINLSFIYFISLITLIIY